MMFRDVWTFNPMHRVSESCSTLENFCRKLVKECRFNQFRIVAVESLHHAKQLGLGKVSHGTSWRHSHLLRESKLHPLLSQAESKNEIQL